MKYTQQQLSAAYGIITRQFTCIKGEARCGKTSMIRLLKEILGDRLHVLTPSHTARLALDSDPTAPVKVNAQVIDGFMRKYTTGKSDDTADDIDFLIIDEASMLLLTDFDKLRRIVEGINFSRGNNRESIHLVYVGDPAQLPPVEAEYTTLKNFVEGPFYNMEPDMWLLKRDDAPMRTIKVIDKVTPRIVKEDAHWLAVTNGTRRMINGELRRIRTNYTSPTPRPGEYLIYGGINNSKAGFFRNVSYKVMEVNSKIDKNDFYYIRFEGKKKAESVEGIKKFYTKVPRAGLRLKEGEDDTKRHPWELSYASTVHSAQGLEYENVIFILEKVDFNEVNKQFTEKLIYTAITRSNNVRIYDPHNVLKDRVVTDQNPELLKASQEHDFHRKVRPFEFNIELLPQAGGSAADWFRIG